MIICLHSGTHFFSRLVRWFTHSRYSHVSILMDDGRHYEAREWKGVVCHPTLTLKPGETVDRFQLITPLNATETAAFLAFVDSTLGAPYDWRAVCAFVVGTVHRESPRAWYCAEFVYSAFAAAGCRLIRTDMPWCISPGDLSLSTLIQPV